MAQKRINREVVAQDVLNAVGAGLRRVARPEDTLEVGTICKLANGYLISSQKLGMKGAHIAATWEEATALLRTIVEDSEGEEQ